MARTRRGIRFRTTALPKLRKGKALRARGRRAGRSSRSGAAF